MEFRVLGPLEVRSRGQALALGGAQQRALLAILLTQANRVVGTDRLLQLLWGDEAPATAEHMLEVYVSNLRRIVEPSRAPYRMLIRKSPGYVLQLDHEQLDASRFEDLVETAKQLPPRDKSKQLTKALSLWRGPAFADFTSRTFARSQAARLDELRLHAMEERIEAELACGRHREVIAELQALIDEHPLRERLCGQLMLAMYRSGRQAEASAVYQETRRRLVDELGIEPGPELQSLLTRILKQDPGLGLRPESIEQPRTNLPVHLTSFVGRKAELQEVGRLVQEFRIVTVAGGGGSGKTRLAVEIGTGLLDRFPDGVWFVDLSTVTEEDFVLQAIASALRLGEQAGRTLTSTVSEHLRTRTALLILDNCEQVVDAAARATEALVTRCPGLHVVATSRERLRVEAEHVHQLSPLALPTGDSVAELERSEAVQLFVDRARLSVQSFGVTEQNAASVGALCRGLDGIPLAMELAAAQISALSPEEILAHLDDQFGLLDTGMRTRAPRQRSIRATIDWSYRLLEPAVAALCRRLAAFSGGFHLNAVESVASDDLIKPVEIAGLLAKLCDRSLVVVDERIDGRTRYRLLETVRAFAAGRLTESGEERSVRGRHAAFYCDLVKGAKAGIEGEQAQRWLDLMETEHDNARSALGWTVMEDRDLAMQLAVAWTPFWWLRGHLSEGRHWLSAVMEGQEGQRDWNEIPESTHRLAEVKQAAGRIAHRQGDDGAAQAYAEEALQIGESLRDKGIRAALLAELGLLAQHRGDISLASSRFDQSLAVLHEAGNQTKVPGYGSATALETAINITLGQGAAWSGDYLAARKYFLRGLEYAQRAGGRPLVSVSLGLGELALVEKDLGRARDNFAAALEIAVKLRDQLGISASVAYSAGLAAASAKPLQAMRLLGAAMKLRETVGARPAVYSFDRTIKPRLDRLHRELGEREAEIQLQAGRVMSESQAVDYAFGEVLGTSSRSPANPAPRSSKRAGL